MHFVIAFNTGN